MGVYHQLVVAVRNKVELTFYVAMLLKRISIDCMDITLAPMMQYVLMI